MIFVMMFAVVLVKCFTYVEKSLFLCVNTQKKGGIDRLGWDAFAVATTVKASESV